MKSRDFSFHLRIGYILVSFVMVAEIGDGILAYMDPYQYALCNFCCIKSLILLIIVIIGFVQIFKGMKKEYPNNLNSIVLGIGLMVLSVILNAVVFFNSGGIEGVIRMGGKKVVFWIAVRSLLNLLGIFFIIHVIHTPRRKKIIAAILASIFIVFTVNLIVYYPKVVDFYKEMEDFVEEDEEEPGPFGYFVPESDKPTEEEILEKYDKEKKPLLVHIIIISILELVLALIFFSSVFFHRDDYDEHDEYEDKSYESEKSWRRYLVGFAHLD